MRAIAAHSFPQDAAIDAAPLPISNLITAAAISLNLWGWIIYGVWSLAS